MAEIQTEALEREMKFGAPLGIGLPDLRDLVSRAERLPRQQLQTAYFDTPDGRLWNQGITLRHRVTQGDRGGNWTLKLPAAAEGSTLNRTEVSWEGPRDEIPGVPVRSSRGSFDGSGSSSLSSCNPPGSACSCTMRPTTPWPRSMTTLSP